MYKGELIAITVAVSWTACAMFAEVASKRLGSFGLNISRMILSLVMLAVLMFCWTGQPCPMYADTETWLWLSLSGLVGYMLGDYCLMNCYILVGSRIGQLLMTLAPPAAALSGLLLLGERMSLLAIVGMFVTLAGIALCLSGAKKQTTTEPTDGSRLAKGVLLGVGAAMGQGVGLVLSAKGLVCYTASLEAHGMLGTDVEMLIPFASTSMRAVTGLVGFSLWALLSGKLREVRNVGHDVKGTLCMLAATITGPFIGVSLSLMATLYTSTGIAQTIMATSPILILAPSHFIFRQRITLREIAGAIISVVGVTLFFL